ncbi:pyridoxamine 5'-phosphate oxidase family protein [Bernardetia sp.]|uniref:pyridoxamine 5'-phosphate oxidase family protein n=1 Tax=Bernardetia sp. TaxID=1937974 RepID=UPI0025C4064F|nr:pyridoxamine 5'-phosphate oxidase family protein [Bernardetia sp.]
MLTQEIKKYIEKSVLCWLATSDEENMPNVSPKEVFTFYDEEFIIIANIASPKSVHNIMKNSKVCVSFIDVFVQKGFQLKGNARIVRKSDSEFEVLVQPLLKMTKGKYPFANIIKIRVEKAKKIIAPSYMLYPETTEKEQVESAKKLYNAQE